MLNTKSALINTLADMHTYCRPAGSGAEAVFCERFIKPLPGAYQDEFLNWHVKVDDAPVLWSAHTDTVHWKSGRQRVQVTDNGVLRLHRKERRKQACLGADDTVGVFILTEMIKSGMPGYYIFHHGEEVGCIGSSALAKHYSEWLSSFNMAIAFDRGGTTDVISHQIGQRTASDAFCAAFARQMNRDPRCGLTLTPSDRGVFTDTVEYEHLIAECTNVSVGYEKAHSSAERVDVGHVLRLLAALTELDVTTLPIVRNPNDSEKFWPKNSGLDNISAGRLFDDPLWDDDDVPPMRIVGGSDRHAEGFSDTDAVYLDPIWAEVQRSLRSQVKKGYGR